MLGTASALLLPWLGGTEAHAWRTRNVLVVVADDLGLDKVEAYCPDRTPTGACDRAADPDRYAQVPPTPRINALAAQGIRFDNAYAEPLCSPTRASLLTGLTVPEHGVGAVIDPGEMDVPDIGLDPRLPTVADILPPAMVAGLVGKWHVSGHADFGQLGAGDTVGGDTDGVTDLCANEPDVAACEAFDRVPAAFGFDYYEGRLRGEFTYDAWPRTRMEGQTRSVVWMDMARGNDQYETTAVTRAALDFVARTPDPWLLVVAFQAPHWPYHDPPDPSELPGALHDPTTTAYSTTPGRYDETRGDTPRQRKLGAMVQSLDHHLGVLLDAVDLDTTTVIFVSDNGTPAATIDTAYTGVGTLNAKLHVYEAGVHVPMIVAGPDVDPARVGTIEDALVHVRDIFATVAELTGSTSPIPPSSVSFAPLLDDPALPGDTPRTHVYSSRHTSAGDPPNNNGAPYDCCAFQVRNDKAKLLVDDLGVQLFRMDLADGPATYETYDQPVSRDVPTGDHCLAGPLSPAAAQQYRTLRNLVLTAYPGTCWLEEHEMNCCDGDDNDGDLLLDGADPDCACDPDNITSASCETPPQ